MNRAGTAGGFIARQIARTNRYLIVSSILLAIVASAIGSFGRTSIRDGLEGPVPLARADLVGMRRPDEAPSTYVTIAGDQMRDTGVTLAMRQRRRNKKKAYRTLAVGDRILIVRCNARMGPLRTLSGELEPLDRLCVDQVIPLVESKHGVARDRVLPFMLDVADVNVRAWMMLASATAAALGAAAAFAVWLRRTTSPDAHPILRSLERWGSAGAIAADIDADMAASPRPQKFHPHVGDRWFVREGIFSLQIGRYDEIVWAYVDPPRAPRSSVVVHDRFQRKLKPVQHSPRAVAEGFLEWLRRGAPWAYYDATPELKKRFKSAPGDLAAEVERRRRAASS
jgi:hypothetical protein